MQWMEAHNHFYKVVGFFDLHLLTKTIGFQNLKRPTCSGWKHFFAETKNGAFMSSVSLDHAVFDRIKDPKAPDVQWMKALFR